MDALSGILKRRQLASTLKFVNLTLELQNLIGLNIRGQVKLYMQHIHTSVTNVQ